MLKATAATQGRIDHDEMFLLPMTSVRPGWRALFSASLRVGSSSVVCMAFLCGE